MDKVSVGMDMVSFEEVRAIFFCMHCLAQILDTRGNGCPPELRLEETYQALMMTCLVGDDDELIKLAEWAIRVKGFDFSDPGTAEKGMILLFDECRTLAARFVTSSVVH